LNAILSIDKSQWTDEMNAVSEFLGTFGDRVLLVLFGNLQIGCVSQFIGVTHRTLAWCVTASPNSTLRYHKYSINLVATEMHEFK